MNISQGNMSIYNYFLEVKNLCREIQQLDKESKIINGLRLEYISLITVVQVQEEQPFLLVLKNIMANQEILLKQMYDIFVKDIKETFYSNKRKGRFRG